MSNTAFSNTLLTHDNRKALTLGIHTSYTLRDDPKHVLFSLARYKFCAKMLAGKEHVLEVGCGDGLGAAIVLQEVQKMYCTDIDDYVIDDNKQRNENESRLKYDAINFINKQEILSNTFDGAISIDVIEHIDNKLENTFMENIVYTLSDNAVMILGTPNIHSQVYASKMSRQEHINLHSADTIKKLLEKYFRNVFIFSMNDEIVHTGYYPMAHYLLALAVCPKK